MDLTCLQLCPDTGSQAVGTFSVHEVCVNCIPTKGRRIPASAVLYAHQHAADAAPTASNHPWSFTFGCKPLTPHPSQMHVSS